MLACCEHDSNKGILGVAAEPILSGAHEAKKKVTSWV